MFVYLLVLSACRKEPDDFDGDGYITFDAPPCVHEGCRQDCDETDPTVNPDAEEICDGIDNNCDGAIDEICDTADSGA